MIELKWYQKIFNIFKAVYMTIRYGQEGAQRIADQELREFEELRECFEYLEDE